MSDLFAPQTGAHAIVTGAAGGIGQQVVRDLLSEGYLVSAFDASQDALDRLTDHDHLAKHRVDVTSSAEVRSAVNASVSRFGTPYGLVNLAGNNKLEPLTDITDETWHFLLEVNLTSTFYLCREVLPLMGTVGEGRVVNTASIFGLRGVNNDAGYAAAKAGVVGLTRALATEYAHRNITVNAIAPVVILTERVKQMPKAHLDSQLSTIPLGRFSETTDISATILFLFSRGGSFYTGQTFSANGGDLMP